MGVEHSVRIDVELASVGQFDRTERHKVKLTVVRLASGRISLSTPSQSGFESITFDYDDLVAAVGALGGHGA